MQLGAIDIVGGVMLVNPTAGLVRVANVVTGIDDHSRFCVIASVVERATSQLQLRAGPRCADVFIRPVGGLAVGVHICADEQAACSACLRCTLHL